MKIPGNIVISPKQFPDENHQFSFEVHNEDETHWYGYAAINPFGGYHGIRKVDYDLIQDRRQERK